MPITSLQSSQGAPMKIWSAALALLMLTGPALAADGPHPFDAHDLVMMDRVNDPQLSPDGSASPSGCARRTTPPTRA